MKNKIVTSNENRVTRKHTFFIALRVTFYSLLFCVIFSSSSKAIPLMDSIYDNVKQQAQASLQDTFNRPVKIKSASGILLGNIVLNGVSVGKELYFDKFIIEFDPIKYAINKGDIQPAISQIRLVKGNAVVVRDMKGRLNVLDILKTGKGGGAPLKAKLLLKDIEISYKDLAGMPYKKSQFKTTLFMTSGSINLRKFPEINLDINAITDSKNSVKINGVLDPSKNSYNVTLKADKLEADTFGNYLTPFVQFKTGSFSASIQAKPNDIALQVVGDVDGASINVSGKIFNSLDLQVDFKNGDVDKYKNLFAGAKELDLHGKASGSLKIFGNYNNIKLSSNITINNGRILRTDFNGSASIDFENNKLKINQASVNAYSGNITAAGSIVLGGTNPVISISGHAAGLDLNSLAYKSPGLIGKLNTEYKISGTTSQFTSNIAGVLSRASLWGQPIKTLNGEIIYKNGEMDFRGIKIASDQSEFNGNGTMSKERDFKIVGSARGLKLKGENALGPMSITVKSFSGDLGFKLDDQFLAAPMKNLSASGSIEISGGVFGKQLIESGAGVASLDHGKASISNMFFKQGVSIVEVSGTAGVSAETDLLIQTRSASLEDLGILNYILPPEGANPKGIATISLNLKGRIDEINGVSDLLKLNISGKIDGSNIKIADTNIKTANLEAGLVSGNLYINDIYLKTDRSEISGYFHHTDKRIEGRLLGTADLDDLKFVVLRYGAFSGRANVDMWTVGNDNDPVGNLTFDIDNARLNNLVFERIYGGLELRNKHLRTTDPINVISLKNHFICDGAMDFSDDLMASSIEAKIRLQKGDLYDGMKLGINGYSEVGRLLKPVLESRAKIDLPQREALIMDDNTLYKTGEGAVYFFKKWDKLIRDLLDFRKTQEPTFIENIGGELSGDIDITGKLNDPKLKIHAEVKNGNYNTYKFDKFNANLQVSRESATIIQAELSKSDGKIGLSGVYAFTPQSINMKISAADMPIDILRLGIDREFSGKLTLGASINGTLLTPEAEAWLGTKKVTLAGVDFNKIEGMLSFKGGKLSIKDLKINEEKKTSVINGTINRNGEFGIQATLEGNSLGLMNLFNDDVKWLSGDSHGFVSITNQNDKISTSGDLAVADGILHVNKLNADLGQVNISAEVNNDKINIDHISGYFYGGKKIKPSPLLIYGYLDFANNIINFKANNGDYKINYMDIYSGNISIKDASIIGPLNYPIISGKVGLSDGTLAMPANQSSSITGESANPIGLNINLNIGKDVYLTSGNISTLSLSNMFLDLEMSGNNIIVAGTQKDPKLTGIINFKRGSVSILNRDFTLLTPSQKKALYPSYDIETTTDNYAEFSGNLMPRLNIMALTKIEESNVDANVKSSEIPPTVQKKEVTIVSIITGTPFSKEKEKILKVGFNAFEAEKNVSPPTYKQSSYSEDEIRLLLLPDFIRSAAGLNKGGAQPIDANAVMADYLNSRLQSYIFRGLERNLEKALGLESLTLEYNFGRDLRRALGAKDVSQAATQTLGVQFVKGFFDRLFIEVKYIQPLETTVGPDNQTYINYQLTLRLTSVLSISYYREPITIYDLASGYSKTSLRAGYYF